MDNITTFVDSVGRVVVGQKVKSKDKKLLQIKEPAVVNVQVNQQSGQISVQLLPFVFREFVKAEVRDKGVIWDFNRDNIVTSDNVELDDAIVKQYENIFTKPVGAAAPNAPAAPEEPEVVKLFDDEA
jgi:hypothetical protein